MKLACVVAQQTPSLYDVGGRELVDETSNGGYPCEEIRILSITDGEKLCATLREWKGKYATLLLCAESAGLPMLVECVKRVFPNAAQQNGVGNAGTYEEKDTTLLLLSTNEREKGIALLLESALPYLHQKRGKSYEKTLLRSIGASDVRIRALMAEVEKYAGGKLALQRRRNYDEDVLSLVYDNTTPKMLVDGAVRMLLDGLGDTMYALNGCPIEEQLVTLLKVRGKKISVAESFTVGGIAKRITSVSGASEVYFEGLNTYDERSKMQRLGVSEYTLRTAGAVSDETAYQMALGLLQTGNCDISVATTGLAGPKSDKSMLPVGLSYIAVGTKEKIFVYRYKFEGTRKEIAEKAIQYALFLAYKKLKDM